MENLYDKVLLMKKYKIDSEQMLLENNINIDEAEEVVKILSSNSFVDLDYPIETLAGECMVSGKVICNLIYSCSNGEINSLASSSPFSYKIANPVISSGARVNIKASVQNTEINRVFGNQLKVITTLNFEGVLIKNNSFEYLKDADVGTYLKQQEREVVTLCNSCCDRFEETLEASVKLGIKKILLTSVDCFVKDWMVGQNFVSVECELHARVLYADKQEPAELQTLSVSKTIKQEIEVSGITKDMDIDLMCQVIRDGVKVDIQDGDADSTIGIVVPMIACINVYEHNKILSVVDIYSTKNILKIQHDEYENDKICRSELLEGKIEGNAVIGVDDPRIDKYIATTNVCANISNSYVKDGELFVEGIVTANVIYLNDEAEAINSVQIEVPFVLDKKVNLPNGVVLEPIVCLVDVDAMVKRGREIFFDAKARAYVNISCGDDFSIISKADSIGEIPFRDDAIEIYFGKMGESFWEIAKNLKIPSEIIRNQNPELPDPLDRDQNIALYFQKERK